MSAPVLKYVFIQDDPFYLPKVLDKYLREFADSTVGINIQSVAQGKRSVWQTALDLYRVYGFRYFLWKLRRYCWKKVQAQAWNDWLGRTSPCYSVRAVARKYDVPVDDVSSVNSEKFLMLLKERKVEFIVSISGTQFYGKRLRAAVSKGIVNCHGGLLPRYRGLMPSFWTLANNETHGGVTVHIDIKGLDDPAKWPEFPSLVEKRTFEILERLAEFNVKATFFVLGWVAERYPQLVARIAEAGHEIGTHSYWHRRVYTLSRSEFKEDLRRSVEVLEQHSGVKVYGFRAPSFSIVPGTEWAFEVLAESGLEYDASLFPAARGHGGYPCPLGAHWVATEGGRIPELPISIACIGPIRMCFSGGGYLRLLPCQAIISGMGKEARAGRPTVFYFHPRDFAPDCPRVPMPLNRQFKSYVGLRHTLSKLRVLLSNFTFAPCRDVLHTSLSA